VVKTAETNAAEQVINIHSLPAGIYSVSIADGEHNVATSKLVKE